MILCDRKKLKNPNGLILGTPGSGKSFSAKREITNAFLITSDDIIICDPEAEYYPLVGRLKGQVIKVSQNSTQYINPMDINLNYSEGDTPIALNILYRLCRFHALEAAETQAFSALNIPLATPCFAPYRSCSRALLWDG